MCTLLISFLQDSLQCDYLLLEGGASVFEFWIQFLDLLLQILILLRGQLLADLGIILYEVFLLKELLRFLF